MPDDERTREVVDQLRVQPESPRFFDEVWERTQRRESAELRRWKRTALVMTVIALGAAAAAGVLAATPNAASNTVDRTLICTNVAKAGLPVFEVSAIPTGDPPPADENGNLPKPPPGFRPERSLTLQTGDVYTLLNFSTAAIGYQLDQRRCSVERKRPALSPGRLPASTPLHSGDSASFSKRCTDVAKIVVRIRIVSDTLGIPQTAQLVVVRARSRKPLVYVGWSRHLVQGYAADRCDNSSPP
jgi:hypothetical protein